MDKYLIKPAAGAINVVATDEQIQQANQMIFGNATFRPNQLYIIHQVLASKDVFVIMPTGGGKSLCYALPAVLSKGVTVVVSPLISLIEDQVSTFIQLPSGGIPSAYLTSNCNAKMVREIFSDLARSNMGIEPFLKLLYVTPERMVKGTDTRRCLQELYQNEMLARFVIDEAHCVSSWGHDFRKDYGHLGILKEEYPETPIIALTATAREKVAVDTIKILNIPLCVMVNTGYDRPNLFFEIRPKCGKLAQVLQHMLQYIQTTFPGETGIVYCMTKKECEEVADFLRENKIAADFYHAGQNASDRKMVQNAWLTGKIKVVCATIAYGMGIDKPNVRYVIHLSVAKSIEGYYQEAGRAGRDGQYSECVLFYCDKDVARLTRIMSGPPKFKLSKKDENRMEEMQYYCENKEDCRRKLFHETFQGQRSTATFQSCRTLCDNCVTKYQGKSRREFIEPTTVTASSSSSSSSNAGGGSNSSSIVAVAVPKTGFQKASALHASKVSLPPARVTAPLFASDSNSNSHAINNAGSIRTVEKMHDGTKPLMQQKRDSDGDLISTITAVAGLNNQHTQARRATTIRTTTAALSTSTVGAVLPTFRPLRAKPLSLLPSRSTTAASLLQTSRLSSGAGRSVETDVTASALKNGDEGDVSATWLSAKKRCFEKVPIDLTATTVADGSFTGKRLRSEIDHNPTALTATLSSTSTKNSLSNSPFGIIKSRSTDDNLAILYSPNYGVVAHDAPMNTMNNESGIVTTSRDDVDMSTLRQKDSDGISGVQSVNSAAVSCLRQDDCVYFSSDESDDDMRGNLGHTNAIVTSTGGNGSGNGGTTAPKRASFVHSGSSLLWKGKGGVGMSGVRGSVVSSSIPSSSRVNMSSASLAARSYISSTNHTSATTTALARNNSASTAEEWVTESGNCDGRGGGGGGGNRTAAAAAAVLLAHETSMGAPTLQYFDSQNDTCDD